METGKLGLASVPVHINSIGAQAEKKTDIQTPLTAVYIQTLPALPIQPYPQPPADARETSALHLAMPPLYSKETLPFLTLHLAGGFQPQLGLNAAAVAAPAPAVKPKSAGKHVCPHCGRDCMKPSVLEKHLRCHTGERPYPCTTCGISFKTQSNLYKHRRTQAHARQSSESEQSNLGSQESMYSSRETCSSSLSLDEQCEELGTEMKHATLIGAESTIPAVQMQSSVSEQTETSPTVPNTETNGKEKLTVEGDKQKMENTKQSLTINRHLQLQRQEATLFSKQWENSVCRGKSQSHESTDSGFSESSDYYPSPSSVLPEHSVDFLSKPSRDALEETQNTHPSSGRGQGGSDEKDTTREKEQKKLEERISKLISENTAVVEDKQLENVRPRKTVLSKQGSIDLPMPYTYKDSFHFDMKINPTQNIGVQRYSNPRLYNSVPTQCSSTMEHAPLTRSSSLPFSVTLLQPEIGSPTCFSHSDYVTDIRRGSSGQIIPTGLSKKPVNQYSSAHRPLVRQTAVDCNHATDSLLTTSYVEEASTGSLSCDGDGSDIIEEPSSRKFRRKKAQKFAYHKWYMYGGGTFKKLYSPDKSGDTSAFKGRKCSTNVVQEAVQGLQKRASVVQKETVTRSGSTSNATAGHLSTNLSLVSSVDLNAPDSSVKAPHRRHLSLSVLPFPATQSVPGSKTDHLTQTEAGKVINVPKHPDSMTELCESHFPSDRKKQKTGDKIISPLEMETDPNTPTQHSTYVTGSASTQVTDLTFVQTKEIPNSPELKGSLFLPCLLNANVSQISTSAATSVPVAAKSSFLPKYQLKLPNAHEPVPASLPQVVITPKRTEDCTPTPDLLSTPTNRASVMACKNIISNPVTFPSMQTQDHIALPCTVTSLCQVKRSHHYHSFASSVSVMQRQSAATTITTSCFQDYTSGLCSALLHCSETATDSIHKQLPRPSSTAAPNLSLSTVNNQISTAAVAGLSHHLSYHRSNPPLGHKQISAASTLANRSNKANVDSISPVVRCRIVPLDQQVENVFHVHTADLQICLQIISDEQMALIAPQIERQSSPSPSQIHEIELMSPEGVQNKNPNFVSMEISNVEGIHEQPRKQKEGGRHKSLSRLNPEIGTHPQSVQPVKEKTEHSDACKKASLNKSTPPQAPSQQPHNNGHLIMVTQTRNSSGSIMATSASFRGKKSEVSQTSRAKQVLSSNLCTEEQFLSNRKVSQTGMVPLTLSGQQSMCERSLSTSVANQNSMKSKSLDKSQREPKHPGASCNADVLKSHGGAVVYKVSRTESAESLKQANSGTGIDGSVSPFPIDNSNVLRQLNPQECVFHSHGEEPTTCVSQSSFIYAKMQLNRVEPFDNSSSTLEVCGDEIQNVISEHSEKSLGQFTLQSASVDMKRPGDVTSIQSRTAGITEGAQKDQDPEEHGETPGQPESPDWRPKLNQGEPETKHQRLDEQRGDVLIVVDQKKGIETDKGPESHCRYVVLPDITKPKGEQTNVDPFKISCMSEQDLTSLSQTNSGMSECLPTNLHQALNTSPNSDLPANSIHTSLLNSPPLESNDLYPPQKNWDRSIIIYDQQMQVSRDSNSHGNQHAPMPVPLSETQSVFLCAEPVLESLSSQDQTKSTISLSAQQGFTTTGNSGIAESCCDGFTVESKRNHSVLPDFVTFSSTYLSQVPKVCRTSAEMTRDIQMLQDNQMMASSSQPFSFLEPDQKQDTTDKPKDFTNESCNSGRPDISNKYQSIFMIGSLHEQPADCLPSGVRPVLSFQDNTEDTSSSDDEGKLIIEL